MAEDFKPIPGVVGCISLAPDLTIPDDLSIPAFLRATAASRMRAIGVRAATPSVEEEWQRRIRLAAEARAADMKAKNAAALARLKAQHEGQRYNRKLKQWVPV